LAQERGQRLLGTGLDFRPRSWAGARMIFKGSRYEKVGVYDALDADGRAVKALMIRFTPPTPAGYLHTFTLGERLDLLANTFYHNPEKFWLIADANEALDPEELISTPGRPIRIPPDRT
jgi:hypothetical protein